MSVDMPDDGLPADPWVHPDTPHAAALNDARLLRTALEGLNSVEAILAATGALADDEARLVVLGLALDAFVKRHVERDL